MLPDLEERVNALKSSAAKFRLARDAWDLGMCPHCGSHAVQETSWSEGSGESEYVCKDCSAQGQGNFA